MLRHLELFQMHKGSCDNVAQSMKLFFLKELREFILTCRLKAAVYCISICVFGGSTFRPHSVWQMYCWTTAQSCGRTLILKLEEKL
jgi:hypothetical protein